MTAPPNAAGAAAQPLTYAQRAYPEPFRILGLKLRPFALGHYLLLQRFDCAEIRGREDLILAVLICSMRHAEFLEFIEQKDFLKQVTAWGKQCGVFDLATKAALFRAYLENALREPDHIALHPGDAGGDWAQNLKLCLIQRLHHSEAEALDLPLAKALADYYQLAESEGLIRLLTPEDLAMAKANAEALASYTQQKAGGEPCPA